MATKKNLKVNITADSTGLQKEAKKAQSTVSRFVDTTKRSLAGVATAVTGIIAAFKGFSSAIATMNAFEAANSRLAAVLGTSVKNIKGLTDAALELGRRTQYTASEVTDLQTELAKLGFTESEIKAMQEPVLKFAAAVGTDLASAAARAGATMRGFGLTAEETGDMLTVMAVSTSKSALSFQYLDDTLGKLIPVTRSFGLDTRATIALLGTLANAGIDASSAQTALRRIMLELANGSSKLNAELGQQPKTMDDVIRALAQLRDGGMGLTKAFDLVGQKAAPVFLALSNGADDCRDLYGALKDANGALDDMYDTMTNNVEGAIKSLQSAWEGFILKLRNSQGFLRDIIQMATDLVGVISGEGGFRAQRNKRAAQEYATRRNSGPGAEFGGFGGMTDRQIDAKIAQLERELADAKTNHIWGRTQQLKEELEIARLAEPIAKAINQAARNQPTDPGPAVVTPPGGGNPTGGKSGSVKVASVDYAAEAREYAQELATINAYDEEMKQVAADLFAAYQALNPVIDQNVESITEIGRQSIIAFEKAQQAQAQMTAESQRQLDILASASESFASIMEGAFMDSFAMIGDFIGDALSSDLGTALGNLQDNLLENLGSLAMKVGELAISTGVAILGIKKSLESLNPYVAIAAGAALVALGAAVRSAASNLSSGMGSYSSSSSALSSYNGGGSELESRDINIKLTGVLRGDGRSIIGTIQQVENVTRHTT